MSFHEGALLTEGITQEAVLVGGIIASWAPQEYVTYLCAQTPLQLAWVSVSFRAYRWHCHGQTRSGQASASAGLVEVQLHCDMSYTTDLYDTPSGRIEQESASTSPEVIPHIIGKQSFTVCHDRRGNVHEFSLTALNMPPLQYAVHREFSLTAAEYAAVAIRGTPSRSVMETAGDAALDSFDASKM